MFLSKGLRIGRIGGIAIGIDYSWFIIFGLFVFLLGREFFPNVARGSSVVGYWVAAVITSLLFFASVLTHELSHAMVARRNGIPINSITLFIFGGIAQMEDEPGTAMEEFKMAIAGPLASIGIAVLFFVCSLLAVRLGARLVFYAFSYLWFINAALAVFNLIPAFPLDGGRVFRAAVWGYTHDIRRATYISSGIGQAFGWILIVGGIASIFFLPGGAFNGIWFALIGWFIVSAARNSYQQILLRETLRQVPINEVMNPQVEAVPADISIDHLVTEYFLRESASVLPVERNGALLGTVSVDDVRNLPRERWSSTLVSEIATPFQEEQTLHPGNDAWDAANQMSKTQRDQVLVTEGNHVEGVVTRGAIMRWLQTHTTWAMGQA
ncbi:MAG TPA: site-2 protease family protein [Armatimonadota bacterium]|nr:site-2 protease family protein [Armatimonadota bacterium]